MGEYMESISNKLSNMKSNFYCETNQSNASKFFKGSILHLSISLEIGVAHFNDKSISFGQGPHYCIGVTLVRSQTEVMLKELFKRYPDLSLGNEIVYDYGHHNARRMDVMMVNTNLPK